MTRAVLVVAIVLVGMTSVFSYLSAVSAEGPKCAGRAWREEYHNGTYDLLIFPLVGALIVVLVGIVAFGRSERLKRDLEVYDLPVLEFASMQVTLGEFVVYSTLLVMLVMLGILTGASATHYNAIVKYCLASGDCFQLNWGLRQMSHFVVVMQMCVERFRYVRPCPPARHSPNSYATWFRRQL